MQHLGFRDNGSLSPSAVFSPFWEILLYGEPSTNSIKCISNQKEFHKGNFGVAYQNKQHLNYPHTMELDGNDNLFVLSNEWPLYTTGVKKLSELTYSIHMCNVKELIQGTVCDPLQKH